ncbi:MAG: hypothetical protein ACFFAN_13355 [Promethearchaeota archaeon]
MTLLLKKNKFFEIYRSINSNRCPICASRLNFDDQNDSIYVNCVNDLKHFKISGFKNLRTGELVLVYLNNNDDGIVNRTVLKEFQKVISRKLYHLINK